MRFINFFATISLLCTSALASNVVSFHSKNTGDTLLQDAEALVQKNGTYASFNPKYKGLDRDKELLYFTLDDGSICSISAKITDSKDKTYVSLEMVADIDLETRTILQIRYNLTCN